MSWIFKGAAITLIIAVALYGWSYLALAERTRELWGHHLAAVPWAFYGHVLFGPIALLAGCLQLMPGLRLRYPGFHRISGYVYIAACLVAGLVGFVLAFGSIEGPLAVSGFAVLAVLWITTTLMGGMAAQARQYARHRRWMLRSYAFTLSAVSLRIMIPVSYMLGFDGAYPYIAWLCWAVNLLVVELYLWARPTVRPRMPARP